ncbi:MAG: A/G-specific adenine glycosylase [Sporolactobacillus sp.]
MNVNDIHAFNHDLLGWFDRNGRDLPWRQTNNPYYIWISEVMLQQTQVETVIPYYQRFIKDFPTPESLADSDEQRVLKDWEGLGYYSRARNLQTGVREVVATYGGKLPQDKDQLLRLHGIGPYTAGALLSIAFHRPEPAIDGNVMRVMSRLFEIDADIAKAKSKKVFADLVGALIAEAEPSAFSQALMDLGAMVCRPKSPDCQHCPVQRHCRAKVRGTQLNYPVKRAKAKPVDRYYAVLLAEDRSGQCIIEQRPLRGLLAGLWQFPMLETGGQPSRLAVREMLMKAYPQASDIQNMALSYVHQFSHLTWHLSLYRLQLPADLSLRSNQRRVAKGELEHYPFPVAHQKVIDWLKTSIDG